MSSKIPYKVGFIGTGNLAQIIIRGLVQEKVLEPNKIYASNRSPGKLLNLQKDLGIHAMKTNEEVIDQSDIIILGTKPLDLFASIEAIASSFRKEHIVLSLAAGISTRALKKKIPQARWARVIPNTPISVKTAVTGIYIEHADPGLQTVAEDLFSPFGTVHILKSEEELEALMVSCSSGTGFCFELMMYFYDWIIERGFEYEDARQMVTQTFLGAAEMARKNVRISLQDLQQQVASKKGVTQAGLQSMQELEIERALRISFEKAALRNQELAKAP